MTQREIIIEKAAIHIADRNVHPYSMTKMRIEEALTEIGYAHKSYNYNWARLYKAICRKHYDIYFSRTLDESLTTKEHPLL